MHLSWLQKTDGAFRYRRYRFLHVFPRGFPELVAKFGFSEIPMRFGLCYLSLASRRKTKEVLSFVPAPGLTLIHQPRFCIRSKVRVNVVLSITKPSLSRF